MNRFLIIDFKKLEILSINKIDMNFEENNHFTGSIKCIDKKDLINTLKKEIDAEITEVIENEKSNL